MGDGFLKQIVEGEMILEFGDVLYCGCEHMV